MIGDAQARQGEARDCMRSPPVCVRWSGENMVVVEGYHGSRFHVMSLRCSETGQPRKRADDTPSPDMQHTVRTPPPRVYLPVQ